MPSAKTSPDVARMIEHSILDPFATAHDVRQGCRIARQHGVAAVVVWPCWVAAARNALEGSSVTPVSVVSFPHGTAHPSTTVAEARQALVDGAAELDVVLPLGRFKSRELDGCASTIGQVVAVAEGRPIKVIIESAALTDDEIVTASNLAVDAGASFVKTSTGFGPGGATVDAVKRIREAIGQRAKIKASGGIRRATDLRALLEAGADRIGTSATITILAQWEEVT